jgi:hypothetical protein
MIRVSASVRSSRHLLSSSMLIMSSSLAITSTDGYYLIVVLFRTVSRTHLAGFDGLRKLFRIQLIGQITWLIDWIISYVDMTRKGMVNMAQYIIERLSSVQKQLAIVGEQKTCCFDLLTERKRNAATKSPTIQCQPVEISLHPPRAEREVLVLILRAICVPFQTTASSIIKRAAKYTHSLIVKQHPRV